MVSDVDDESVCRVSPVLAAGVLDLCGIESILLTQWCLVLTSLCVVSAR